jgi:precorrin-3B C17-methyltransferase
VHEDIAIVFRRGRYDLFLGGKPVGRSAAPAKRVAEGLPAEGMVDLVGRIVHRYQQEAFPGERFYKFFKRAGELEGFLYSEETSAVVSDTTCGI